MLFAAATASRSALPGLTAAVIAISAGQQSPSGFENRTARIGTSGLGFTHSIWHTQIMGNSSQEPVHTTWLRVPLSLGNSAGARFHPKMFSPSISVISAVVPSAYWIWYVPVGSCPPHDVVCRNTRPSEANPTGIVASAG